MQRRARSPRLSRYYTLARLVHSDTARERDIDNAPPPALVPNLRRLARGLDRIRLLLGHPLDVSSGYRSPALNAAVGGALNSQHAQGLAADFTCPDFGPPLAIARALRDSAIAFDTMILEFDEWIHVSFTATPRRRVLTIYDAAEGYLDGLLDAARRPVPSATGSASRRPRR
jgi:zinc D-Ala-D-Ala carboxypeptidase